MGEIQYTFKKTNKYLAMIYAKEKNHIKSSDVPLFRNSQNLIVHLKIFPFQPCAGSIGPYFPRFNKN
jgi:hypothetical protein